MSNRSVVLVLNAGSSSLKFSAFEIGSAGIWRLDARGQIDGIGTSPRFVAEDEHGVRLNDRQLDDSVRHADAALETLAVWLRARLNGAHILAVGHRVVHGGAWHATPTVVTPSVMDNLRTLIPLAPLHQPFNLAAIDAVTDRLPGVPQVACFDTSFHRGHSAVAELIPLPIGLRRLGVRRYGFHGLSYEYIASVLPVVAPDIASGRVIVAHLGSGASLCALQNGRSIDSSLGFTALDGLCMGTRPGALDPGVVLYLFQGLGMAAKDVETLLYQKSGLLGISGISNDMRALLASREPGARLAIDYFVYRAAREIGGLAAVLGGIDGLVFTAGIGQHSPQIRARVSDAASWLGVDLDHEANNANNARITTRQSRVSAWVIATNEELMIARHTGSLLGLNQSNRVALRA